MPDRDRPDELAQTEPTQTEPTETSSSEESTSPDQPGSTEQPEQEAKPETGTPPASPDSAANRRRTWQSLVRPGRGQVIAAVILFVVGLGGVMQIKSNQADEGFSSARRTDLVQLLDGLGQESRRLETEIAELERTRTTLQSGADSRRVAREEAQRRINALGILAGTEPAEGPGVRITVNDPSGRLTAEELLDGVEELRDAGAEVIEINDSVRVVASTWFGSANGALVVDGQALSRPITLEVIGDSHSLSEGVTFRGGFADKIKTNAGADLQVETLDKVRVESLHRPVENQYAQPASPRTPGR